MAVLEIRGLKKFFGGKVVLDGVNFSVDAGECLGMVGRSGCGKSTAAKIIARLIPSDGGQIFLCGQEITNATGKILRAAYRNMQMIFQMPEDFFDPRKTLGWSIGEPLKNSGVKNSEVETRVKNLLVEVGLPAEYFSRYPHEVSGGECQRAAIARAISISPKLLICDEATSALDVTVQAQVVALIKNLCREKKIACLFITHDLALLPRIANKVIVMHGGKIVEEGTPEKIIAAPESDFTKELMATDFFAMERGF